MVATGACVHHWVIEPPVTIRSAGRCNRCGQTRFFDNMLPAHYEHGRVAPMPSWPHVKPFERESILLADEAL